MEVSGREWCACSRQGRDQLVGAESGNIDRVGSGARIVGGLGEEGEGTDIIEQMEVWVLAAAGMVPPSMIWKVWSDEQRG